MKHDVWPDARVATAIGEGFVEVGPDRVSVITEVAIEEKFIDEAATVAAATARARRDRLCSGTA